MASPLFRLREKRPGNWPDLYRTLDQIEEELRKGAGVGLAQQVGGAIRYRAAYAGGGGGDGDAAGLHNALPDLQGGWPGQYYHFAQLHHDQLADFIASLAAGNSPGTFMESGTVYQLEILRFYESDHGHYIGFSAPTLADSYALVFPNALPAGNDYALVSSATGVLSWSTRLHNLLSARHGDTLAAAVAAGSLIYGNATPAWAALAHPGAAGSLLHTSSATAFGWTTAPRIADAGSIGFVSDTVLTRAGANLLSIANQLCFEADTTAYLHKAAVGRIGAVGDFQLAATKKFYLDGGGNTYAVESSDDVFDVFTGGTRRLRLDATGQALVGSATFTGAYGSYSDDRCGLLLGETAGQSGMVSLQLSSTYNHASFPNYGLILVNGPNTGSYDTWAFLHDGPARAGGLHLAYGAQGSNMHTATPVLTLFKTGHIGIASGKRFQFDGVSTTIGDTYQLESSANILDFYAGGVNQLRLAATYARIRNAFYVLGNETDPNIPTFDRPYIVVGSQAGRHQAAFLPILSGSPAKRIGVAIGNVANAGGNPSLTHAGIAVYNNEDAGADRFKFILSLQSSIALGAGGNVAIGGETALLYGATAMPISLHATSMIAGHFLPSAPWVYSCGAPGYEWAGVYAGTIVADNYYAEGLMGATQDNVTYDVSLAGATWYHYTLNFRKGIFLGFTAWFT